MDNHWISYVYADYRRLFWRSSISASSYGVFDFTKRNISSTKFFCYTENANSSNHWMYDKKPTWLLETLGKNKRRTSWHLVCVNTWSLVRYAWTVGTVSSHACGSNFKGSEQKIFTVKQMMLWCIRYRFRYQLHWMNILVCSLTAPVVYVEGVNSRLDEDRQRIYLALGKNTFH